MQQSERITFIGILLNALLFCAKIVVGSFSGSIALISDALNSLIDVLTSIGILFAVRISNKKADKDHPFGHHRAEPIAALMVAIFAGILGFEIIKSSFVELFEKTTSNIGLSAILVLLFTMIVKSFMAYYFTTKGKKYNRPAIKAAGIDSRNDILVSFVALLGVLGSYFGFYNIEPIAAIFIGFFVIYSGYKIAKENIDFLMGHSPPLSYIDKIKESALIVEGVTGINDIRAHYVGNYVQAEVHIEVDQNLSTRKSHDIGKTVQKNLEGFHFIDKVFIHIDPI